MFSRGIIGCSDKENLLMYSNALLDICEKTWVNSSICAVWMPTK